MMPRNKLPTAGASLTLAEVIVTLVLVAIPTVWGKIGATPNSGLSESSLNGASLIVAGHVKSKGPSFLAETASEGRSYSGRWQVVTFEVDHVLRGKEVSAVEIQIFHPIDSSRTLEFDCLDRDQRYIICLKSCESEDLKGWQLVATLGSAVPSTIMPDAKTIKGRSFSEKMEAEFLTMLKAKSVQERSAALVSIGNLTVLTPALLEAVEAARHDSNSWVQLLADALWKRVGGD